MVWAQALASVEHTAAAHSEQHESEHAAADLALLGGGVEEEVAAGGDGTLRAGGYGREAMADLRLGNEERLEFVCVWKARER